jgi:[FeFe] hydrogenase H-cluster maturation GTPase HydF
LLSGQKEYAIVDETPGTTSDTVLALMEIHGLGPCKLFDTAGIDEYSSLGEKRRKKAYEALEESDLCCIVIDLILAIKRGNIDLELALIKHAKKYNIKTVIIYNIFWEEEKSLKGQDVKQYAETFDALSGVPSHLLSANNEEDQSDFIACIQQCRAAEKRDIQLLPNVQKDAFVVLVIPMDEETPTLRLLRPQDMAIERLLRNFSIPVLFRMDLTKARSENFQERNEEKNRFLGLIQRFSGTSDLLSLVLTDSQAFDVVADWIPHNVPLSSFSIMMAHYMSGGNIDFLIEGVQAGDTLKEGDHVLIAEACNHNRKCNDIGTVQIPRLLRKKIGKTGEISFSFGRTFPDDLTPYKLIVHCGACMIDRQKYRRRVQKAKEEGVAFTNYGFFLSYEKNKALFKRVVQVFMHKEG